MVMSEIEPVTGMRRLVYGVPTVEVRVVVREPGVEVLVSSDPVFADGAVAVFLGERSAREGEGQQKRQ
jgi:hypothetical protein